MERITSFLLLAGVAVIAGRVGSIATNQAWDTLKGAVSPSTGESAPEPADP